MSYILAMADYTLDPIPGVPLSNIANNGEQFFDRERISGAAESRATPGSDTEPTPPAPFSAPAMSAFLTRGIAGEPMGATDRMADALPESRMMAHAALHEMLV